MKVYLQVPYCEKELAKRRGCRWDAIRKQWYIIDPMHIELYKQWIPNTLINKACTASNVS